MKPITTDSTFPSLLKTCMECKWVSIDMEFYRRTTYYPQLCLIQIASPNFVEMIDVLACDKKTLNDFLRALAEHPLLVFYSPDQDLEIWKLWTGSTPNNVFDVQVAMTMLGFGLQVGFSKAVESCLGIRLDKSQQKTDWRCRPLSQKQLDYAEKDATNLADLYDFCVQRMDASMQSAVIEESLVNAQRILKNREEKTLWWLLKAAQSVPKKNQRILQELAIWREQCAQQSNKARQHFIRDEMLINIAMNDFDIATLTRLVKHPEYAKTCYEAWFRGKHGRIDELLEKVIPYTMTSREKATINAVKKFIKPYAQELNIQVKDVAGNKTLLAFMRNAEKCPLFIGWRYWLVGRELRAYAKIQQAPHNSWALFSNPKKAFENQPKEKNPMHLNLFDHLQEQNCQEDLVEVIRVVTSACKDIAWRVKQGALADVIGEAGSEENVQGEVQQKLDVISNVILKQSLLGSNKVAGVASEEEEEVAQGDAQGSYLVAFDPLDGSSNINVAISVGTIFSILPHTKDTSLESGFLQPGRRQVAAGYVLYGSSVLLVLSVGKGVHFYNFDQCSGEFLLINESVRAKKSTQEFAINMSNHRFWQKGIRAYIDDCLRGEEGALAKRYNMRWVASMVADVHRILVRGGIFLYPWDTRKPDQEGKLRLLYEANPMSFLIEQAGGQSSNGKISILDIQPKEIHQRVPVILGSSHEVDKCLSYLAETVV